LPPEKIAALIPAMLAPFYLILHAILFVQLRRQAQPASGGA
jgi:hypothetical protein